MAAVNQQQLRLWFDQIDLDKNGVLNVREVQKCLALNQLAFSLTSTNMLMRLFDTDHAGVLSFQQFIGLHQFLTKYNGIFDSSCRTEQGKLTINELKGILQREGIHIEDTAFYAMCESFDPDRDGRFANPEFVVLMAYVQSCQATFAAFDPQRTGTVSMNFGQFMYACSKTR